MFSQNKIVKQGALDLYRQGCTWPSCVWLPTMCSGPAHGLALLESLRRRRRTLRGEFGGTGLPCRLSLGIHELCTLLTRAHCTALLQMALGLVFFLWAIPVSKAHRGSFYVSPTPPPFPKGHPLWPLSLLEDSPSGSEGHFRRAGAHRPHGL